MIRKFQEDIAATLGCSQSTVSNHTSSRTPLCGFHVHRWAQYRSGTVYGYEIPEEVWVEMLNFNPERNDLDVHEREGQRRLFDTSPHEKPTPVMTTKSQKQLALELGVSPPTVSGHTKKEQGCRGFPVHEWAVYRDGRVAAYLIPDEEWQSVLAFSPEEYRLEVEEEESDPDRAEQIIDRTGIEYWRVGKKTMLGHIVLPTGYEITKTASCVDPADFDSETGKGPIYERIIKEVRKLLAFQAHGKL